MHHDKAQVPAYLPGLVRFLALGILVIALHLLGRALGCGSAEAAHRSLLRLRGTLALLSIGWYGRYVLLPKSTWPGLRWFLLPTLAVVAAVYWPLWPLLQCLAGLRAALLVFLCAGIVELVAAVLRGVERADLSSIPAREAASGTVRRDGAHLCFLAALTIGVCLFLLSIDFVFDFLVYSLLGAALVLAAFLAPLLALAARLEESVAPLLTGIGRHAEGILAAGEPPGGETLAYACWSRQAVLDSCRLGLTWWYWLYPAGSAALLLLAAVLYQF